MTIKNGDEAYEEVMKFASEVRTTAGQMQRYVDNLADTLEFFARMRRDLALINTALLEILNDVGGEYQIDKELFDKFASEESNFKDTAVHMFPEGEIVRIKLEKKEQS